MLEKTYQTALFASWAKGQCPCFACLTPRTNFHKYIQESHLQLRTKAWYDGFQQQLSLGNTATQLRVIEQRASTYSEPNYLFNIPFFNPYEQYFDLLHNLESGLITHVVELLLEMLKALAKPTKQWGKRYQLWCTNLNNIPYNMLLKLPSVRDIGCVSSWTGKQRRSLLVVLPISIFGVFDGLLHTGEVTRDLYDLIVAVVEVAVLLRQRSFSLEQLSKLNEAVKLCLAKISKVLQPYSPSDCNIAKLHMLCHSVGSIRKFGALHNVNTESGEHHHSISIKRCYARRKCPKVAMDIAIQRDRTRAAFQESNQIPAVQQDAYPIFKGIVETKEKISFMGILSVESVTKPLLASHIDLDIYLDKMAVYIYSSMLNLDDDTHSQPSTSTSTDQTTEVDIAMQYCIRNITVSLTVFNTICLSSTSAVHASPAFYGKHRCDDVSVSGPIHQEWFARTHLYLELSIVDNATGKKATHPVAFLQWYEHSNSSTYAMDRMKLDSFEQGDFDLVHIECIRTPEVILQVPLEDKERIVHLWWAKSLTGVY